MFDYIKGKLVSKLPSQTKGATMVVENNGMGYLINTTTRSLSLAEENEDEVKVYTTLIHREDAMLLCGFLNREDRIRRECIISNIYTIHIIRHNIG